MWGDGGKSPPDEHNVQRGDDRIGGRDKPGAADKHRAEKLLLSWNSQCRRNPKGERRTYCWELLATNHILNGHLHWACKTAQEAANLSGIAHNGNCATCHQ